MLNETEFNTWIEALESGKYPQGKGCLRSADNTYCCLGVAADALGFPWALDQEEKAYRVAMYGVEKLSFLPFSFLEANLQVTLAGKNDSGATFAEIAQYLKDHKDAYVKTV